MLIAIVVLIFLILLLVCMKPYRLHSEIISDPANSYEDAVTWIEAISSDEEHQKDLNPVCTTQLLTHGKKVAKVIVFLHGFTSCPNQFARLGEEYFNKGYNVYIPRIPRHGISDRLGNSLKGLCAEELAKFAAQSTDIARGLGERVIVAGVLINLGNH